MNIPGFLTPLDKKLEAIFGRIIIGGAAGADYSQLGVADIEVLRRWTTAQWLAAVARIYALHPLKAQALASAWRAEHRALIAGVTARARVLGFDVPAADEAAITRSFNVKAS